MLMTIGGNTPLASSGWTMDSPSFTLSCTLLIASPMTAFPAVSRVMFNACKIGTPLVTRVPSVRVKREMELLRMRSPKSGARSLTRSIIARPAAVFAKRLNPTTMTTTPPMT